MAIEDTKFGSITIDGKTYEYDVIVRLSGKVEKRKKKLSKEQYGTSHIISMRADLDQLPLEIRPRSQSSAESVC